MAKTSPPPCELYIVRHAIAAERGDDWPDDDKRPLTEKGVVRFKDGLAGLNWLDVGLDEIFSSPLVRAKQTADLLAAGISGRTHRTVSFELLGSLFSVRVHVRT